MQDPDDYPKMTPADELLLRWFNMITDRIPLAVLLEDPGAARLVKSTANHLLRNYPSLAASVKTMPEGLKRRVIASMCNKADCQTCEVTRAALRAVGLNVPNADGTYPEDSYDEEAATPEQRRKAMRVVDDVIEAGRQAGRHQ